MKKTNKIIIICIAIFLIISIIAYGILKNSNKNFNNIKEDKSKYIVYTKKSIKSGNYHQDIPYINIKSESIKIINEDIDNYVNNFKNKNTNINYEFNINGIILSLIIKVEDHNIEVATVPYFRSYNISLNTYELVSNELLLNELNLTQKDVINTIDNKMKYYYKDISTKEYFDTRECDYQCFLKNREIDSNDYLKDTEFFIRNGKLIVFKPYIFASFYGEEEYFTNKAYEFEITK